MGLEKGKNPAFNQVVLRLDEKRLGVSKKELMDGLAHNGIFTWHANFELLPTLSFFKCDIWKDWILRGDIERVSSNYHREYPNAQWVFGMAGLGLGKENFLSANKLKYLCEKMDTFLARKGR